MIGEGTASPTLSVVPGAPGVLAVLLLDCVARGSHGSLGSPFGRFFAWRALHSGDERRLDANVVLATRATVRLYACVVGR